MWWGDSGGDGVFREVAAEVEGDDDADPEETARRSSYQMVHVPTRVMVAKQHTPRYMVRKE